MLKIKIELRAKCKRHARYDPAKDGRAGIKGGCAGCELLLSIYDRSNEFSRNAALGAILAELPAAPEPDAKRELIDYLSSHDEGEDSVEMMAEKILRIVSNDVAAPAPPLQWAQVCKLLVTWRGISNDPETTEQGKILHEAFADELETAMFSPAACKRRAG